MINFSKMTNTELKGVHMHKNTGNYEAFIRVTTGGNRRDMPRKYVKVHIGTYATPQAAVNARLAYIDNLK